MSTVWFARPTITPSANTRADGPSTGMRVCSSTTRKTSSCDREIASAVGQPQSDSATGFMKSTRPPSSVAITASPMLVSTADIH